MDRVYQYFKEPGNLFPYDVRYDPSDIAHCERQRDGLIRFHLVTEPGFTDAVVARTDGHGTPMRRYAEDDRFAHWEAHVDPEGPTFDYSFALRFGSDRYVYLVPAGITNAAERLDFWSLDVATAPAVDVPPWAQGAIIYQIFPDRFASGDPSLTPSDADQWGSAPHPRRFQGGDLYGIAQKTDYLSDLGVDAVYLNPIFSSLSVHRYDAIDYYRVDERLGGNEALRHMVDSLHAEDIKVILDASFNHCHPQFFAFEDVIANGPTSPFWDWFEVREYPISIKVRPAVARALFEDRAEQFIEYHVDSAREAGLTLVEVEGDGPPIEPSYAAWYGVPTMPRLVLANPDTRRYFLDVTRHWIREFEIDGWRMDVARYVDHDFWIDFRQAAKAANPSVFLMAEIMGDAMPWLQGDRFDATMNYQFRELALDFLAESSIDAGRFADGLIRMYARYSPTIALAVQNLIGSHDTERFLTMAGGDVRRLFLAVFTQMTVPGAPGLYYGDEVGMTGGSDPGSRGAFPWNDREAWDAGLLEHVRSLAQIRKGHPALRAGDFDVVWRADNAFAFTRCDENERLLVVVNRSEDPASLIAPIVSDDPTLIWGEARVTGEPLDLRVEGVGPWTGAIISY